MKTLLKMPGLKNNIVGLRPFDSEHDMEYLISLAQEYRYNRHDPYQARALLDKYFEYGWVGYVDDGIRFGVVYICYYPDRNVWTFDAYRDDALVRVLRKNNINYTYEAGKIILPYILEHITPQLMTMHDVRNRAATVMCRRLGFKDESVASTPMGVFICMRIGREDLGYGT